MTSKTSLFNMGIYKSTVKRNLWGSIAFFVYLFVCTSMPLIIQNGEISPYYNRLIPLIYNSDFILPSMIISIALPTVVAMLVFRFVHSKRTAVFTHSLPVTRTANFVSTVVAAFTLMFAPVIANGIVLMILSLTSYSGYFSVANCLVWMAFHLYCMFIMFSISTFAAMITGNTFATPVINFILHVFAMAVVAGFCVVSSTYLYGFTDNYVLLKQVVEYNPAIWIINVLSKLSHNIPIAIKMLKESAVIYAVGAIAIYGASLVAYKKRAMETAEDVAAFKILNHIYKYAVTFVATLGIYAIMYSIFEKAGILLFVITAVLSALVYFGCEMLLKKTFNVWKSYKGFVAHSAVFAAIICVFAFTSFFGFETRVPDASDVQSVAIYNYYYSDDEPYVEDSDVIDYAIDTHKEFISMHKIIDTNNSFGDYDTRIHFKYKLKNGKTLDRVYKVKKGTNNSIMEGLYKFDSYVMATEAIFCDNEIIEIHLHDNTRIKDENKINEFMECMKKDTLNIGYGNLHIVDSHYSTGVDIQYKMPAENGDVVHTYGSMTGPLSYHLESMYIDINANYKNTIQWLKQNGYWDSVRLNLADETYIGKVITTENESRYMEESVERIAKIDDAQSLAIISDYICNFNINNGNSNEYVIYQISEYGDRWDITKIDYDNLKALCQKLNINLD